MTSISSKLEPTIWSHDTGQWIPYICGSVPIYRIYSIKRPGAYLIFGPSGWVLIRGEHLFEAGHLLNFHHFQQAKGLFCNKTVHCSVYAQD